LRGGTGGLGGGLSAEGRRQRRKQDRGEHQGQILDEKPAYRDPNQVGLCTTGFCFRTRPSGSRSRSEPSRARASGASRMKKRFRAHTSRGQGGPAGRLRRQSGGDRGAAWVSFGTVRVHLKTVFQKTHTNRQAQLASVLLRLGRLN
jgi:hypothetical protein